MAFQTLEEDLAALDPDLVDTYSDERSTLDGLRSQVFEGNGVPLTVEIKGKPCFVYEDAFSTFAYCDGHKYLLTDRYEILTTVMGSDEES